MREDLRAYIDKLFADAPNSRKVLDLKEELLSDLTAKYDDLIAQGRSEEDAFKIAVGSIGDVNELIKGIENDKIYNYARQESDRRRSALFVSTAVALYIIAIIFPILLQNAYGAVGMFCVAAVATALLIFNAMSRPKYYKADDTFVEEFKEWKYNSNSNHQVYRAICSALWPLIVALYFLISFLFNCWEVSWIIFIIGVAVQNIIKFALEMRHQK